jgi:hypothetical protein
MCRATRRTVDIPRNCVWARQWSVANCKEIRRRRVCCTSGRFIRDSMSDPLASAATRSWGRCCPSIPSCEQRHVDGGVIRQRPPLEHDTAEAGHFQAITVRSQPARVGVGFAMHAVKCDKLPQICKQRRCSSTQSPDRRAREKRRQSGEIERPRRHTARRIAW